MTVSTNGPSNRIERALFSFFLVLCLVVWAVLGFAFWVMVLVRMSGILTWLAIKTGVTGQAQPAMQNITMIAISYYGRGFRRIQESMLQDSASSSLYGSNWRLVLDSICMLLFWSITLAAVFPRFRNAFWTSGAPMAMSMSRQLERFASFADSALEVHPGAKWVVVVLLSTVLLLVVILLVAVIARVIAARVETSGRPDGAA